MNQVFSLAKTFVKKNEVAILGALALSSIPVVAVTSSKAAVNRFLEEEETKYLNKDEELDIDVRLRIFLKHYYPTILVGGAGAVAVLAAIAVAGRREAALIALLSISEKGFQAYKEEVKKRVGEKKEEKIREASTTPESPPKTVVVTGKGDFLAYDSLSGRYFRSSIEEIRKAVNDFNYDLINHEPYKVLNDLYDLLGLEPTEMGAHTGWDTDTLLEVKYDSKLGANGEPSVVLVYERMPKAL